MRNEMRRQSFLIPIGRMTLRTVVFVKDKEAALKRAKGSDRAWTSFWTARERDIIIRIAII
eukprot:2446081-Amphidinium_carterae.1